MPLVLFAAACGGGGGGGGGGSTPRAPQGAPVLSPARVQITSLATPATVSISEPGYGGSYATNASACAGIATVAPAAAAGAFTVTGIGPGQCAISFTDSFSQSVALPVSVTASTIVTR